MTFRRVVPLLVLLALGGCRSLSLSELPWPSQMLWLKNLLSEREEVTYYATARENFHRGMELYLKEEWQDASKYFDYVRTKFPHSRYATIAELRLADSHFGREKWMDAMDAYRQFTRLHPTHEEVAYATFQVAKAHYRQIPEDWFFLPDASERDQSAAMDAVRAFDDFLIRFPDHERAEEARKLRKEARSRLANHEWYVAGYYERKHPRGAAFRYERIADQYPDVDFAPTGLLKAARIWEKEKDWRRARVDYERTARDYPKHGEAKAAARAARRMQELLEKASPAPAPAPVAPPAEEAPPAPSPAESAAPAEEDPPQAEEAPAPEADEGAE
ncbi:MAG: outer membrane protein assembly factor BamD [Deltaproteobacteria bacterium]|nr:outer membrane protein assembly factor BamD [Deltaproteobacteria bacterium]